MQSKDQATKGSHMPRETCVSARKSRNGADRRHEGHPCLAVGLHGDLSVHGSEVRVAGHAQQNSTLGGLSHRLDSKFLTAESCARLCGVLGKELRTTDSYARQCGALGEVLQGSAVHLIKSYTQR
ncbi:hypothetical protein AMTR_s00132p00026680 [Amborella trichopoda]|uniref:Uncharacterized protein n=1 Tax=Amborella trichopoda TaxID=13333 RepID=W1NDP5_AMBTC|nr:hypothetical protein AMTR_s00132p00026680 [Amborella trichopoda]